MTNRDADFSEATKEVISRRSGYRCAFLGCDQTVVGPGKSSEDTEYHGVVGHIFSSAPNGPRGTGGLSSDERKSPSNGILACSNHSKIFDNTKGKDYPASLLQSWKAIHESKIAKELKGLPVTSRAGWVKGITFLATPLFKAGQKITFGKVTLLFGGNGTGKTAICEWLSAASGQIKYMERWSLRKATNILFDIEYLSPETSVAKVEFKDSSYVCSVNGTSLESLRHAFRVVYLRNDRYGNGVPSADIDYLAHQWGIHPFQVPNILSKMGPEKYGFVRSAEIREELIDEDDVASSKTKHRVYATVGENEFDLAFGTLSGREQGQVILIGAMIIAEELSQVTPTVLIVELPGTYFPDGLLAEYAERLAGPEFQFQTVLISPNEHRVNWTGWSIARFKGRPPEVEIHQNNVYEDT